MAASKKAAAASKAADKATTASWGKETPAKHSSALKAHADAAQAHNEAAKAATGKQAEKHKQKARKHENAADEHAEMGGTAPKLQKPQAVAQPAKQQRWQPLIMTSPKGARYYVSASGQKVYVKDNPGVEFPEGQESLFPFQSGLPAPAFQFEPFAGFNESFTKKRGK